MILLIQFIAILLMLLGLAAILVPRFHGAFIILAGCALYIAGTGYLESSLRLLLVLAVIAVLIEISKVAVSQYLAKSFGVPPKLSTDTTAGNLAGIIVTDALFGLLGTLAFETIISKTLLPRLNTFGKIFVRLAVGAVFRLAGGAMMIFLVLLYT
jgi:uncharacterized protein YqgC (DUF456 family)